MPILKPVPGVKVRDPITLQFLPEEGKEVPLSTYWTRRLAEGSVVVVSTDNPIPDSTKDDEQ
jgi:hypothetical protein